MEKEQSLTWEDIKSPASAWLFDVMPGGSGPRWARTVWQSLERRGHTSYDSEEGRHHVVLRLFALAVMYREFCFLAWGEGDRPALSDWADELGLDPVEICAMAGDDFVRRVEGDDEDADLAYEEALRAGVDEERDPLLKEMIDMFGGKALLFAALMKTGQGGEAPPAAAKPARGWDQWSNADLVNGDAELRGVVDGILDDDGGKNETLDWVDGGMYPLWW